MTYDVLTMGRSCIDLYAHQIGVPITEVTSFDAYVGGCPTNISVGTRRLGLRSALLTALGDDQVGDFVLSFLDREGVETRYIPRKPGKRTSAVIMAIQPPDRFPLTFYREGCADRELTTGDVDAAPVGDSAIVLVTGTGLSHDPGRTATFHAAERAAALGAQLFVDVDYRPDQWRSRAAFASSMQQLLRHASLVIGTEEEIAAAGDADDVERAIGIVAKSTPAPVVIKRGARGATLVRDGTRTDIAPFRIEVLNVLGAGDAFASGLIAGIRRGWPLERAIRMGNATGAIVVTRHGCANFMPTDAEVEAFVREQGGW
ncbi:MAG TPA: 5-dehydro-2-deoxygluconokinase [Vicinamibacterales bacterium]|jgi:5-dehydro-2-deoxygluconokinase|nr:5-dehydro-2-deoxygluconokinase [Vicinamibacterales bacterium]